jgi:hypothetical protein
MNEEKFSKCNIHNRNTAALKVFSPYFMLARKLKENNYMCNFMYNFMCKCLDMSKIHFVEGDTDSTYWAVSGSEDDTYEQGLKHVIKNHTFYNDNIYKYTPSNFIPPTI